MLQGPEGGIGRRDFLGLLTGGVVAASGLPSMAVAETTESAAEILDWKKEVPAWFLDSMSAEEKQDFSAFVKDLNKFEGQENMDKNDPESFLRVGNPDKYRELSLPLIEDGLDTPQNLRKLRYLIYRELKRGYKYGASTVFRPYDAEEVWNDKKFFGDIGYPEGGNYIDVSLGVTSDIRIEGKGVEITPNKILGVVDDRIPSEEGEDIAFIIKDSNGKDIFLYYEGGKLKLGFPTTVGAGDSTPSNLRVTERLNLTNSFLDDKYKIRDGETKTEYDTRIQKALNAGNTIGGAMPYSHRLEYYDEKVGEWKYDGHNTHIGNVTEYGESHGCARQTILGAYIAFYGLKTGTIIYYRPELQLK